MHVGDFCLSACCVLILVKVQSPVSRFFAVPVPLFAAAFQVTGQGANELDEGKELPPPNFGGGAMISFGGGFLGGGGSDGGGGVGNLCFGFGGTAFIKVALCGFGGKMPVRSGDAGLPRETLGIESRNASIVAAACAAFALAS